MNDQHLARIKLQGYRSIANCDLNMRKMNVLIGPNGAGKSNFMNFFKLIQQMLSGNLQRAVSKAGGPDALLHFGRKKTESLRAGLYFGNDGYIFTLEPTADNRMMYAEEILYWNGDSKETGNEKYYSIGSGHFESGTDGLKNNAYAYEHTISIMKNWQVYHFHDTGESSPMRQLHSIHDSRYFRSDASNLAAYLYDLQRHFPVEFRKIEIAIRLVAPFFGGFILHPQPDNPEVIELGWFESGEDMPFKAHHLSDGLLRFICLATLLLQPHQKKAETIIIDGPELGLHPYAITVLAGLLKSTSHKKQIVISTQCVDLLSEFSPEDVVIVNYENNQSILKRLESDSLQGWLDEYSLGELWKKNLLGGRP